MTVDARLRVSRSMRPAAVAFAYMALRASAAMSVPPNAPWAFGMSPEEVESVTDFGPCKRFMNGTSKRSCRRCGYFLTNRFPRSRGGFYPTTLSVPPSKWEGPG